VREDRASPVSLSIHSTRANYISNYADAIDHQSCMIINRISTYLMIDIVAE
jgi:hypothetical protein